VSSDIYDVRFLGALVTALSLTFVGGAVWIASWYEAPAATAPVEPVGPATVAEEDTGEPEPPPPRPQPAIRQPKPTPAPRPTTLAFAMRDPAGTASIEVVCGSDWRERRTLAVGRPAVFTGVPQDDCTAFFHGPAPAQFGPVHAGDSLDCRLVGTTAVCDRSPARSS
jgi:hypothetical protein